MFTTRLRALSVFVVLAAAGSGLLLAQSPQAVGTWVGVGTSDNPFGNGASVALSDGRTLIVGGAGPDGAATNVVSSFDTAANQFAIAGTLLNARTGHTATLLKDARVLVTGGTADSLLSTEIELFDPSTGSSTLVAQMPEPRRSHVAALLQNGSVLIAGGYTTGDVVLQSAFIFDPATNAVSPTPAGLSVARASASATTLIDGRVAIIGGTDGTNDLRSAEIFDATLQSFTTASTQLTVPVRGHSAVLLPNNGSVLIAGGTSNGAAQAGAELFLPAEFPDPFSWGIGQFAATAPMNAARWGAVAGPSATEGYAVVTGGGSNSVERYRFATIKTDKDDYAPGEHALITGTGWQPAEQVTLTFQEDPAVHDDYVLTLTADEQGKISTNEWAPEQHDLNVRFYLMASGSRSKAQTTFTDGLRVTVQRDAPPAAALTVAHGSTTSVRFKIENNNNGGDSSTSITVNYTLTASGSVVASAAPLTGTVTLPNNGASVLRSWDVTAGGPPFTGTVTLMATIVSPACSPGGSNACSSSADYSFTITPPPPPTDSTPPVINPFIAGTLGLNGWYTSDVTVSWNVTDLESAIGSSTGCATTTLGTDTAGTTITCSATSAGGTRTQSVTIKRDATAPTISSSRTPANSYGWNNAAVTVSFTCFDATSGLAAGSPPVDTTVSTEGGNQSVGGMCTDLAGNSASATVNDINIDTTVPSISAGRLPAANGNGWNNTDVVASYNASDALSGLVESATGTYTFELEAAGQEHPFEVHDKAGNSAMALIGNVNIDKTGPTGVAGSPARGPDHNGWYNAPVLVTFTGTDTLSGIASCTSTSYSTPDGTGVTVPGSCADNAGNVTNGSPVSFNYDSSAPKTPIPTKTPAANSAGWNKTNVTVSFAADGDNGPSGVSSCSDDVLLTTETTVTGINVTGTCTDNAGNVSDGTTINVKIDKTAPTSIVGTPARPADHNGWYNAPVGVTFSGNDALSGVASCTSTTFSGPDTTGVAVNGSCTDTAGNVGYGSFSIKYDVTAPSVILGGVEQGKIYSLGAVPATGCTTADETSGVATSAVLSIIGGVPPGVGQFTATCSGAADQAGNAASNVVVSYTVQFAGPNVVCNGAPGHQVLQPINFTGSSVFPKKGGSTVPVKFRVCGVDGVSVGPTAVVQNFQLTQVLNGTASEVNETDIEATNSDTAFRWSASDAQWIFNLSTKNLNAGRTYVYLITLNGGSTIEFRFALK